MTYATIGAGVAVLAVALHFGALGQGFVNWDDNRFITANPLFSAGGWSYVRAALTQIQFEAYHPLHLLSYLPDRWLWSQSPAGRSTDSSCPRATPVARRASSTSVMFICSR